MLLRAAAGAPSWQHFPNELPNNAESMSGSYRKQKECEPRTLCQAYYTELDLDLYLYIWISDVMTLAGCVSHVIETKPAELGAGVSVPRTLLWYYYFSVKLGCLVQGQASHPSLP